MGNQIKLSIVVPVYNAEPFIAECLESIWASIIAANDGFATTFEILLIDDCSTDHSLEICKAFKGAHAPHVKIIRHNHNMGLARARDTGIRSASGEYIAWVDSDDAVARDWFGSICKAFNGGKPDAIAFDFIRVLPDKNEITNTYGNSCLHMAEPGYANADTWAYDVLCSLKTFAYSPTKIFRADLFGPQTFDAPRGALEDMGSMVDILPKIKSLYYIPAPLYIYKIRKDGLVGTLNNGRRILHVAYMMGKLNSLPKRLGRAACISMCQLLLEVISSNCSTPEEEKTNRKARKLLRKLLPSVFLERCLTIKQKITYLLLATSITSKFACRRLCKSCPAESRT